MFWVYWVKKYILLKLTFTSPSFFSTFSNMAAREFKITHVVHIILVEGQCRSRWPNWEFDTNLLSNFDLGKVPGPFEPQVPYRQLRRLDWTRPVLQSLLEAQGAGAPLNQGVWGTGGNWRESGFQNHQTR